MDFPVVPASAAAIPADASTIAAMFGADVADDPKLVAASYAPHDWKSETWGSFAPAATAATTGSLFPSSWLQPRPGSYGGAGALGRYAHSCVFQLLYSSTAFWALSIWY